MHAVRVIKRGPISESPNESSGRGHRFVRYADDCNIYVHSQRAGQRVMESITLFISQKLKLKVNSEKSAVARPRERKFLGFSFTGTAAAAHSAEVCGTLQGTSSGDYATDTGGEPAGDGE